LIGKVNAFGGTTSFTRSAQTRTVTDVDIHTGATVTLDKDVVAITNNIVAASEGFTTIRASAST